MYRELLVPAFRVEELDSEDVVVSDIASGEGLGLGFVTESGDPLSVILGYPFDEQRVLLIGYLATDRASRSAGLGGRLLDAAADRWHDSGRFDVAIAEIADPRFHLGEDGHKRVCFYARNGGVLLQRPYFQPSLRPDVGRVYGMLLVVLWAGDTLLQSGIPAGQATEFVRSYFTAAEGPGIDDARYRDLIASYEATPSIPLAALDQYTTIEQINGP
jgi:GNAT superfamily N-acetyltransferase